LLCKKALKNAVKNISIFQCFLFCFLVIIIYKPQNKDTQAALQNTEKKIRLLFKPFSSGKWDKLVDFCLHQHSECSIFAS